MSFEAIIFDLDQTLIDTAKLKSWREQKDWEGCKERFYLTTVFPGVQQMLQKLKTKKIAVVTNSSRKYAEPLLEYHNILYEELIAFNPQGKNKPYPNQLLKCAENLNVSPQKCIYVGDDQIDIFAAKAAGMTAIAFASTKERMLQLIPSMPTILISDFNDLLSYVNMKENGYLQKEIRNYCERLSRAKQINDNGTYLQLLEQASELGDAFLSYQLGVVLYKNPDRVRGNKNHIYYFWKAAKQMYPDAINALGYFLEEEGRIEEANEFYRIGAYLGNAKSQVQYGIWKSKQLSSDLKIKVISHLFEKAAEGKNKEAQELYNKFQDVQNFERYLKKLFSYDRSHSIFYVQDYIPSEKEQDWFSEQIIKLKEIDEFAVNIFFETLEMMPEKDLVIAYVPSSNKEKRMTGVRKLAMRLAEVKGIDGTDCLVRVITKEKSSQGGERSRDIHLKTMEVRNGEIFNGKHVLLLDDVTTSGSSLLASEQMLLEAGAFHVTKVALGRTRS
ncbi:HAD-IA family hydrolase [Bacillus cereus]|uniref:HAD-IA family hydrolase n=1 Tax=Bacillus cereus TaxID=1396 RepID=UPI000977F97B|nr:HAD-IA family hydrolase [Bacillus cereus]ONH02181.1 hypothetical protein BKK45_01135 [Bacillus cereus]